MGILHDITPLTAARESKKGWRGGVEIRSRWREQVPSAYNLFLVNFVLSQAMNDMRLNMGICHSFMQSYYTNCIIPAPALF